MASNHRIQQPVCAVTARAKAARSAPAQPAADAGRWPDMRPMGRLAVALLTLLGAVLFGAPRSAIAGETPPPPAASAADCDPAQLESISCGTYYFSVAGRVVYAARGGSLVPIRGARFFQVDDPTHGPGSDPRELKVKTRKSGEFSFHGFVSMSSRSKTCPDGHVQTREIYLPTFLLLRANDCDDLVIRVEKDWDPGTIVMTCPGRT